MSSPEPTYRPDEECVEHIRHRGRLVCLVIRSQPAPGATRFYTPTDLPLQVGNVIHPAGSAIARHSHRPEIRKIASTSEVLVVQKGRLFLDIYADDETFLGCRELSVGDVILLAGGGHGLRFAEDTVLLEVKQGPFQGDHEKVMF